MSGGAGARVRLGVIGLGTVAQAVHLPLLARHRDRLQVTALCDLSAELMAVVAERAVGPAGVRFGLRWQYLEDHPEYARRSGCTTRGGR
jgi:predicted dehydrogenase